MKRSMVSATGKSLLMAAICAYFITACENYDNYPATTVGGDATGTSKTADNEPMPAGQTRIEPTDTATNNTKNVGGDSLLTPTTNKDSSSKMDTGKKTK